MFSKLKSLFGSGQSGSPGADAWLAEYRRLQPQGPAAIRLETDSFSDEGKPVTIEQPDETAVRQAVVRVGHGRADFLTLSRGADTDGDFLQAARDSDGSFLLEAQVTPLGKPHQQFHSRQTLSAEALTEAALDYRSGGNQWTTSCSWEFGTR